MTPGRLKEVEAICLEALALQPAERSVYLDRACKEESMRREVESLLAAESAAGELFSSPDIDPAIDDDDSPEDFGTTGPYEVQERLGAGGMGVVFRARQTSPVVRDIALKIIRPGMASRSLVARFQMERQTLALMEHPNIARVLDAGATSRGMPYLVMELVAGQSITKFCDARNLTVRERVELMIPVCLALQHAHQKGIIHRDIKPSNVLVTIYDGKPVPKVIDFGIAKAIESTRTANEGSTRPGVIVGTFEYASPEQAEPGVTDVDTRTDIYSLGALFYQMLTGATPLENLTLDHFKYTELLRRIREEIPPPASSRTSTRLEPELDWILAKALEKDRERRYPTVDGLAQDLRRYLGGLPVEAGPPSVWYRTRKFAARHRYWLGATAVFAGVLIAAMLWMVVALRQQRRANANARALRDVVRKIIVERPAQLAQIPNRTALRAELMGDAEGALGVLSQDAGNGDVPALLELAKAYLAIGMAKGPYSGQGSEGDPAGAAEYVRKSADLYSKLAAIHPDDIEIRSGQMEALSTSLALQYRLDRLPEGKAAALEFESVIAQMTPSVREKIQARRYLSRALVEKGAILFRLGEGESGLEADRLAAQMLREGVPAGEKEDPEKLDHLSHVQREVAIAAWMFGGIGQEAQTAARGAVDVLEGCSAANCRMRRAQAQGTLGEMEWAAGNQAQGIATLRQSLAAFEALAAEDPANAVYFQAGAQIRDYLALVLAKRGSGVEAVALAERNTHLPPSPDARLTKGRERTFVHQITLGAALLGAKRFPEAERELRETLESNRDWNPASDLRWSALHLLAQSLSAQGKFEPLVGVAREARKFADQSPNLTSMVTRVINAVAVWDYAHAVAEWKGSTGQERAEAREALDKRTAGLDSPYAVFAGALLEPPPTAEDVAAVRKLLSE